MSRAIEDPDALRLLTLVAHELRTPLTVASGYLKMLGSERLGPLTEAQQKAVTASLRATEQLLALAADISQLAKIDRGQASAARTLVRASALVEAALAPLRTLPHQTVTFTDAGDEAWVSVDRARVAAALGTLATALARALPEESCVRITRLVHPIEGRPGLAFVIDEAGSEAPAALPSAEALGPLDEWQGGLGIGLPLAHRVVTREGGRFGTLAQEAGPAPAIVLVLPTVVPPDEPAQPPHGAGS